MWRWLKGVQGRRGETLRGKKEREQGGGGARQWNDGLIEWIQISFFLEEVGEDRAPRERSEKGDGRGDNETEETKTTEIKTEGGRKREKR